MSEGGGGRSTDAPVRTPVPQGHRPGAADATGGRRRTRAVYGYTGEGTGATGDSGIELLRVPWPRGQENPPWASNSAGLGEPIQSPSKRPPTPRKFCSRHLDSFARERL